jgi:exocyst complex component 3
MGLEGQEYVSLLSWIIQTYPGQELMRNPSLGIPAEKVKPLLDNKVIDDLQAQYLKVSEYRYLMLA